MDIIKHSVSVSQCKTSHRYRVYGAKQCKTNHNTIT